MLRKSRQREAILEYLRGTNSHPTAYSVYEAVRQDIPNISLGTVYRNLKVLSGEGQILELVLAGGLSRFDGNMHNHYHFRCEGCGCVFDVAEPVDASLNSRVAQETGFEVSYHITEFRGICRDCGGSELSDIGR